MPLSLATPYQGFNRQSCRFRRTLGRNRRTFGRGARIIHAPRRLLDFRPYHALPKD
jgi:hypothetical protein